MICISTFLLSLLPGLVVAKSINVDVGLEGFTFTPDTIQAAVGDLVHFHFYPGDHSVAQSRYSTPCQPSGPNAIFSGFFDPDLGVDSQMFTITINHTAPIWLYCSKEGHCPSGMSMVINPRSKHTLTSYKLRSLGKSPTSPSTVQGGVISKNHGGGLGVKGIID